MSDHHVKARSSSSGFGMLAGLRQLMRECPSLSPLSPNNTITRRQTAAAAAAAAAAQTVAGGSLSGQQSGSGDGSSASGSTPRRSGLVSSFEAAWDRVLHPPLASSGGGVSRGGAPMPARNGPPAACQGLQLQLSLSAPCRRMSMEWSSTSGSTPHTPISPMQRQQQEQAMLAAAASGSAGTAAVRAGSPLGKGTAGQMNGFHTGFQQQQQQDLRWPGVDQEQQQKGESTQEEEEQRRQQQLAKMQELGRGGDMDAIIDNAIQQMQQRVEPSATDLVALGATEESVFARAAAAAAASGDASAVAPLPCTPVRAKPPLPPQQLRQQQHPQVQTPPQTPGTGPRSFYLADQGPLTSPLCARWAVSSAGGMNGLKPLAATPFGSQWQAASSPVSGAGAAAQDGAAPAAGSGSGSGSVPGTPQRMLLPVMSMRLTCQPAWQYNSSTGAADAEGSGEDSAAAAQTGPQKRKEGPPPAAAAGADVSKPSLTLSDFIAATDAAATGGSSGGGGHKPAVHMHQPTQDELRARQQEKQCEADEAQDTFQEDGLMASPVSCSLPQGLWPTVSFSLVPVRLQGPTSPKGGGFRRTSGASCLA
jgi:hypothetical protein